MQHMPKAVQPNMQPNLAPPSPFSATPDAQKRTKTAATLSLRMHGRSCSRWPAAAQRTRSPVRAPS
eukprot:356367-Chlamydomonas_euryale.AAC.4